MLSEIDTCLKGREGLDLKKLTIINFFVSGPGINHILPPTNKARKNDIELHW